jgi:excisionase family DNA binding protein
VDITPEQLRGIIKDAIHEALPQQPKATMTIQQCAEYSGIGRDKLMELAHSNGDFPSFKVGSKFLVNRQMFITWLEKVTKEGRAL